VAQKKKKKRKKKEKQCSGDLVCENPSNFNLKTPQKHYIKLKKLILNLKIPCD
jgi:hypothetical protein